MGGFFIKKIVLSLISLFLVNFTLVAVQVGADGSANYSIPIKTMPGINGLEPKLSINYNSNASNGILGVGFQLQGLAAITRVNNGGGINYNENDTFAGPGGKLVLVDSVNRIYHSENTDWVEYVPYTNDGTRWSGSGGCGNGPCFWRAYTTSGKILEFGKDSGRVKKVGSSAVRVWGISKVEDTYGNYYTVGYSIDNASGDYYPIDINQPLKGSSGIFGRTHKVKFLFAQKTDVTTSYAQNAKVREDHRMTAVEIYSGGLIANSLVRKYNLTYEYSPATKKSRITKVQECAEDGSCLEPTKFSWGNTRLPSQSTDYEKSVFRTGSPTAPTFTRSYTAGDVNGDGRTDIMTFFEYGSQLNIHTFISRGNGKYDKRIYHTNSSFDSDWTRSVLSGDVNGDGRTDIMMFFEYGSQLNIHTFISKGNGYYDKRVYRTGSPTAPTFTRSYTAGDVNGDGRTDIMMFFEYSSQLNIHTFISQGNGSYYRRVYRTNSPLAPKWTHSVLSGDVNGDGRTDIVMFFENGSQLNIHTFISRGNGYYDKRVYRTGSPVAPTFTRSYTAGDVNGDGRTDIMIFFEYGNQLDIHTFISRGNGQYDKRIYHTNSPLAPKWTRSALSGDVNGDGRTDIMMFFEDGDRLNMNTFISRGNGYYDKRVYSTGSPTAPIFTRSILSGDANGDGRGDIIMFFEDRDQLNLDTFLSKLIVPDIVLSITDRNGTLFNIDYLASNNKIDSTARNGGSQTYQARRSYVRASIGYSPPKKMFSYKIDNHHHFDTDNWSTISNPDINGDGRSDVCWRHDTGYFCARSRGNGSFTHPEKAFSYKIENHHHFDTDNWSTISNPDINGDGRSDVCWRHDTGYFCAKSRGDGSFTHPALLFSGHPSNHSNFTRDNWSSLRATDINGDGRPDVCWRGDDGYYCRRTKSNGTFTHPVRGFSYKIENHHHFDTDNWSTISNPDINGDGRSDVCWRHDTGYFCARSLENGTFTDPEKAFSYKIENHHHFDTDNWSTISNPDINGDGRSDVCWRHDTGYFCARSRGNGSFTDPKKAFSYKIENHLRFDTDNWSTISNPDINGDGKSDVCWRHDTGYFCAKSLGDGTFTRPALLFSGHPSNHPNFDRDNWSSLRATDINGDGRPDVCWRGDDGYYCRLTDSNSYIRNNYAVLRYKATFSASNIGNNTGSCLSGGSKGYGGTCGIPNPSPRYLVKAVKMTESVSSQTFTTTYGYKDGRYYTGSVRARANLGFAEMRTNHANGNYTINRYYQTRQLRGQMYRSITYTSSGRVISKVANEGINQYRCNSVGCVRDNSPVLPSGYSRQIRVGRTAKFQYKLSPIRIGRRLSSSSVNTFNVYGLTTKVRQIIFTKGGRLSRTTHKLTEYLNNITNGPRVMALPIQTISCVGTSLNARGDDCASADQTLKKTRISYDGNPHATEISGGDKLSPTKIEKWSGEQGGSDFWVSISRTFNQNGTLESETDGGTGNQKSYVYDSSYPNVVKGITTTSGGSSFSSGLSSYTENFSKIDTKFITPKRSIDKNGLLKKKIDLDSFGRVTEVRYKDIKNNRLITKQTSAYVNTPAERSVKQCRYYGDTFSKSICSKKYKDSLGRTIKTVQKGMDGTTERDVITEVAYDRNGREWKVYVPYWAGGRKSNYTEKRYDYLGRLSWVKSADHAVTRTLYDNVSLISGSAKVRSIINPKGVIKRVYSDLSGKIVRIVEAAGTKNATTVNYTYKQNGLLKSVQTPQGTTMITYNDLYQQESITDPNAGTTDYTYYATQGAPSFGQIKTEMRPEPNFTNSTSNGTSKITVSNEYNASFGRLSRQYYGSSASPRLNNVFTYDNRAVKHSQGQLTRVVSTADKYTIQKDFSYDVHGRRLSESKNLSHSTESLCANAMDLPCRSLTSWVYDELGRVAHVTHPDGTTIINEYIGGTSLLRKIKNSSTDYVTYSGYNINAQPGRMVYSNGVDTSYKYDSTSYLLRRLKVEVNELADSNTPGSSSSRRSLLDYGYSFDLLGNVTSIYDHTRYSPEVIHSRGSNYHYDNLNRLTSVDRYIGKSRSSDYFSYGFKQNRLVDINEGLKKRLCYVADCDSSSSSDGITKPDHERVLNASGSYVKNSDTYEFYWSVGGNLLLKRNTTNGTTAYRYDARNMLRSLRESGGKITSHYYDESGQRFLKVYKETRDSPEIRTYYLSPSFELREKWSGDSKRAFQSTLYITGADGQRAVSKTSGSYLLSEMRSEQNYRLAGMYNSGNLEGLLLKAKHIILGVYYETSFEKILYLSFVLLSIFLVLCLAVYYHKQSEFSLLNSVTSAFTVLMVISAFSCSSQTYVSVDEGDQKYEYSLMGSTSGGLPMGTYYYHGNHLGSSSLITNSSGREVMRISYTPYGSIEQKYSGRIGCSMGTVDTLYADCTGKWNKLYDVTEGANAGVTHKFTGQEYDPENSLYYYNARYYDPSIGIFTTADTIIPDEYDPLSYNRHMYVRGNPINYTDPSGHSWKAVGNFFKGLIKGIGSFVSTVLSPITAIVAGIQSLATGASFTSTFTNHFNGVAAAASSLILAPVALNPLLTGIISELSGGSFEEGFAAGLGNLGLAFATFGGSLVASAGNAYAAGYYGIYGRNERGNNDYFLDHTIGQGTTAIGTVAALAHLAEGGKFEKELSRGTGSFMYSNTSFSRSNSVGNVIGLSKKDSAQLGTAKGKRVLRHELVHSRQYRRGGLFNLARLGLEYFGAYGSDPYNRPGTLENEAKTIADNGLRPWYFENLDDRFF